MVRRPALALAALHGAMGPLAVPPAGPARGALLRLPTWPRPASPTCPAVWQVGGQPAGAAARGTGGSAEFSLGQYSLDGRTAWTAGGQALAWAAGRLRHCEHDKPATCPHLGLVQESARQWCRVQATGPPLPACAASGALPAGLRPASRSCQRRCRSCWASAR